MNETGTNLDRLFSTAERSNDASGPPTPFASIIVPARNEEGNVGELTERLARTLERFTEAYEIIFICDGFEDGTTDAVRALNGADSRVRLLHLSRGFGHQNAVLAGLDHASGRVVITMDADLQHPPETVADLLLKWEQGYDVVHAIRQSTEESSAVSRATRSLAYRLLRRLCDVDIVPQSADFKLYDRSAVDALRRLREQGRFNRGLASWVGFRHASVHYDEAPRASGRAAYSFARRLLLLMDGMFSLSSKPLQYLGVVGLGISALAALYLVIILVSWAVGAKDYHAVAGWSSTVAIVLFVGGVQLSGLWLMGQYLARTYNEVKGRPCYIVADAVGLSVPGLSAHTGTAHRLPRAAGKSQPAPEASITEDSESQVYAHV